MSLIDSAHMSVTDALKQQADLEEAEQKDLQIFVDSVELALRDKATRHLVREILKWCGLTDQVAHEPNKALFYEGRRSIGWELKALFDQMDRKIYPELLIEGIEYEKALYKS